MRRRRLMASVGRFGLMIALVTMGMGCDGENPLGDDSIGRVAKIRNDLASDHWHVCIDRTGSYQCAINTEEIRVDQHGRLFVENSKISPEDLDRYPLVAEFRRSDRVIITLSSLPGEPGNISPMTTLLRVGADLKRNRAYSEIEEDIIRRYNLSDADLTAITDFTTNERSALFGRLLVDADEASMDSTENLYRIYLDDTNSQMVKDQFESYVNTNTREGEAQGGVAEEEATASDSEYTHMLWQQGMDFGVGYNDIDSSILSAANCLEKNEQGELEFIAAGAPMIETYNFQLVNDVKKLRKLLKVQGQVSLNLNKFELNAEAKVLLDKITNENSVYVFAELEMIFRDYKVKNPRLRFDQDTTGEGNNDTIRSLYQEDYDGFRQRCGDRFLNVITTGGRYWGLIEIAAKNEADKLDILGRLEMTISKFQLSGQVAYITDELETYEDVRVYVASRGAPSAVVAIGTEEASSNDPVSVDEYCGGNCKEWTSWADRDACETKCKDEKRNEYAACSQLRMCKDDCDKLHKDKKDELERCYNNCEFEIEGIACNSEPNFGNVATTIGTLNQFYANIEAFKKNLMKIDNPDQNGNRDYRQAAYLAKFEPYEQIADPNLKKGGDVAFEAHCMDTYADVMDEYMQTEYVGKNIIENPYLYQNAFKTETVEAVNDWLNRITLNKAIVISMVKQCMRKKAKRCFDLRRMEIIVNPDTKEKTIKYPEMELAGLDLPEDIMRVYPQPKIVYPKNCKERKELFSRRKDDEYLLYLGRNPENKFFAYCEGMSTMQDADGTVIEFEPKEFLTLRVTSPLPEFGKVRYNFSNNVAFVRPDTEEVEESEEQDGSEGQGEPGEEPSPEEVEDNTVIRGTQISLFRKIRIHITDTHIALFPKQENWFEHNGLDFYDDDLALADAGVFGTASTCSPELVRGANINLRGTPFRIDVPGVVQFGTINDGSYEVFFDQQKNWTDARDFAESRKGHLPIISDDEDNEFYQDVINDFYLTKGAWLGLMANSGQEEIEVNNPTDSYKFFKWYPGNNMVMDLDYWNWWDGYVWQDVNLFSQWCVFMRPDGLWEYETCDRMRPVIVEYKRIVGEIKEEEDSHGQVFDIYVRSKSGGCGSFGNIDGEIILTYDFELAKNDPWLNEIASDSDEENSGE